MFKNPKNLGLLLGFIGISIFAFTMPMTKIALQSFSPWLVSLGRSSAAGLLALAILVYKGKLGVIRQNWKILLGISGGIVIGFPLFSSLAMAHTTASHAGIVLAILPLMTAIVGSFINNETQPKAFWVIAATGSLTVLTYVLTRSEISFHIADLFLLAACVAASFGYSLGAKLTKRISGLDVICAALVITLPVSIPATIYLIMSGGIHSAILPSAILAMVYVTVLSQLIGFVPWYKGLAMGGVAVVSQVQLLQVFITLLASASMLGEHIGVTEYLVAAIVVGQIYVAKKLGKPVKNKLVPE